MATATATVAACTVACSSPSRVFLLLSLICFTSIVGQTAALPDVHLGEPVLDFTLSPNDGNLCQRIQIIGLSRMNLKSYANVVHVNLNDSGTIPARLNGKLQVCFHRNASLGVCQCEEEKWEYFQKGKWSTVVSPFEKRYLDIKLHDRTSVSFRIFIEEEFQQWRLVCLSVGVLLLFMAPIISNWVPFYYSSSMFLGVLLVILFVLFQGMKLLPMGRKNILYLTIYGSVLGVGSYIIHYFSTVVNSILASFGLGEEMHNPVSVFLVVFIILAGAALGYFIVRKFVLSEDGSVDAGIAQFVKWAMRFFAVAFFFQSTADAILALVALMTSWSFCHIVSTRWSAPKMKGNLWQPRERRLSVNSRQAEFLSPSSKKNTRKDVWRNPNTPYAWSNSPMKGITKRVAPSYGCPPEENRSYYSTYHKIPQEKYTKQEWEDFTHESTSDALAEWASTPEVAKWLADNAHRMRLEPEDSSDDSSESSSSDSEETSRDRGNGLSFWKWY